MEQGNDLPQSMKRRRNSDGSFKENNGPLIKKNHAGSSHEELLTDDRNPLSELSVVNFCPEGDSPSPLDLHRWDGNLTLASSLSITEASTIAGPSMNSRLCNKNGKSFDWANDLTVLKWLYSLKQTMPPYDVSFFARHPTIQPKMRSIVLHWLAEVCCAYDIHRETYYLTVHYFDRYLSTVSQVVSKNKLQLIGISCLMIAGKYEEITPMKLSMLSFVTDGACSEHEILEMELKIIKTIKWKLMVVTPNRWLSIFLQLMYQKHANLFAVQYPINVFEKVITLLDLASLDENYLHYSYRILAATALYLVFPEPLTLSICGLKYADLSGCINWLSNFWEVLLENCDDIAESFEQGTHSVDPDVRSLSHLYVKSVVSLDWLESAQASFVLKCDDFDLPEGILTPPHSSKKNYTSSTSDDTDF